MIRSLADVPEGFELRTDVCVIGSGSGGGVAAGLFAEAGREVVLLEEGPHVPGSAMTQREGDMYPLLYRDGGNQMTSDGGISVLQGRALGGSTVINTADVEAIPDGVLEHWRQHHGLTHYGLDGVREAEAACGEAIGATKITPEELNRNNQLLLEGAERLGLSGDTFVHNRRGCIGSGYCLIGCAYDAKQSVAVTWIPRALATGNLLVQTEARARAFEVQGSRVVAVVGDVASQADQRAVAPFRVRADTFVLAAGSIHSPLILSASGLGGRFVGRHLTLQPQLPVAAMFPDDVTMYRGIPQAAFIGSTETADAAAGLGGFRLESISAGPGMAASITSLVGDDVHRFMRRYNQVAAVLCLTPDAPGGRVSAGDHGRPVIAYGLTADVKARLLASTQLAARLFLEMGADGVMMPYRGTGPLSRMSDVDALHVGLLDGTLPMISAHPQGTARMGPAERDTVVGPDLRVHGTSNLAVMDASVFPTSAATHTMLPVMTYAWLASHEMIARGG